MKLTALAVVILSLGIVVGFALAGGVSGPASAVPQCPGPSSQCATPTPTPPPQQREDQITIFASGGNEGIERETAVFLDLVPHGASRLALDPDEYPAMASFQLEGLWETQSMSTICIRLFDRTANTPVAGSEACLFSPTGGLDARVRSAPMSLAIGEHEYVVQGKCEGPVCNNTHIQGARIIVEWTE